MEALIFWSSSLKYVSSCQFEICMDYGYTNIRSQLFNKIMSTISESLIISSEIFNYDYDRIELDLRRSKVIILFNEFINHLELLLMKCLNDYFTPSKDLFRLWKVFDFKFMIDGMFIQFPNFNIQDYTDE